MKSSHVCRQCSGISSCNAGSAPGAGKLGCHREAMLSTVCVCAPEMSIVQACFASVLFEGTVEHLR